jgi:hypothetical protein
MHYPTVLWRGRYIPDYHGRLLQQAMITSVREQKRPNLTLFLKNQISVAPHYKVECIVKSQIITCSAGIIVQL